MKMRRRIVSNLFDELTRIVATPIPRRRALRLIMGSLAGATLLHLGLKRAQAQPGAFQAYSNAIDLHVMTFIAFAESDPNVRNSILADYDRAKQIRANYYLTGQIPNDPLVEVIGAGSNGFELGQERRVAVLLSPDSELECARINFTKSASFSAHLIVIDGSRDFWVHGSPEAKFASMEFTIPQGENTLSIRSESYGNGTIILKGAGPVGEVVHGVEVAEKAVEVTVAACARREQVGRRCECVLECQPPNGRPFALGPFTIGCCDATETARNNCDDKCDKEALARSTGGIICRRQSSLCVADATCQ
jgi:hypothetical protein